MEKNIPSFITVLDYCAMLSFNLLIIYPFVNRKSKVRIYYYP